MALWEWEVTPIFFPLSHQLHNDMATEMGFSCSGGALNKQIAVIQLGDGLFGLPIEIA